MVELGLAVPIRQRVVMIMYNSITPVRNLVNNPLALSRVADLVRQPAWRNKATGLWSEQRDLSDLDDA